MKATCEDCQEKKEITHKCTDCNAYYCEDCACERDWICGCAQQNIEEIRLIKKRSKKK